MHNLPLISLCVFPDGVCSSRSTPADESNDRTTLDRALDERLVLIVKPKPGAEWRLPESAWEVRAPTHVVRCSLQLHSRVEGIYVQSSAASPQLIFGFWHAHGYVSWVFPDAATHTKFVPV